MKCEKCNLLPVEETAWGCETDFEYKRRKNVICQCKNPKWIGKEIPYYLKRGGVNRRARCRYYKMLRRLNHD